jgi:hypothetical protein
MTTVNSWGTNDPVGETHGGTSESTYSKGDILYASGANTLAKLAVGTDNYVLGLSSGVPAWEAASAGGTGAWVPLAQVTASDDASVSFNSTYITSTYNIYVMVWHNYQGAAEGNLRLRFSPDNGSTIRTSGYDAEGYTWSATGQSTWTSGVPMYASDVGADANEGGGIIICYVVDAATAGNKTNVLNMAGFVDTAGLANMGDATGVYDTAEAHNYFQWDTTDGNLDTGTCYLYGVSTPA